VSKPKHNQVGGRQKAQYAIVEDPLVANVFSWLTENLSSDEQRMLILPGGSAAYLPLFKAGLRKLGISPELFSPSGMRSGGASHYHLIHADVPALRRRLRHTSEKTLEHYLHESVFLLNQQSLTVQTTEKLRRLANAAPLLCPPPTPAPPIAARLRPLGVDGYLRRDQLKVIGTPSMWNMP
jgi:hypothetical protein